MIFIRCFLALIALPIAAIGEPIATVSEPELGVNSWIMIEIWPEFFDITLTAYFLDYSFRKNKRLCEATKRVFDREQEYSSKESGTQLSSYRVCWSDEEARSKGYFER